MRRLPHRLGYVVYRGPSLIDGAEIIVIVTGLGLVPSTNTKTGPMAQAWILVVGTHPVVAVQNGLDYSICGSCALRGVKGRKRGCYVDLWKAAAGIWRAFVAGRYRETSPAVAAAVLRRLNRGVRIGAYGDPSAVPDAVWLMLTHGVKTVTGYTHGPSTTAAPVMVSVESETGATAAKNAGLRYFRVGMANEQPGPGEILCPASEAAGHSITCSACGLCDGNRRTPQRRAAGLAPLPNGLAPLPNVFIHAHGVGARFVGGAT